MAALPAPRLTPEDYLAIERKAEFKSEYLHGEIFAMSGATRPHNLITLNIAARLHNHLRGKPCEAYTNDMRVRTSPGGLYTYPDVVVVCGQPQFADEHGDTLTNPVLIVEVLSPSTEGYDRGEKFTRYQQIETLQEYILVSQDTPRVERFTRQGENSWLYTLASGLENSVTFASIDCALSLSDVYERVDFPPAITDNPPASA